MQQPTGADDVGGGAGLAQGRDRSRRVGRRRRIGDEEERLAPAIQQVAGEEEGEFAQLAADRRGAFRRPIGVVGLVHVEILKGPGLLGRGFEFLRHAGGDQHHAAHGVAGIGRGERAIENIHALDLLGRDHAPARAPVVLLLEIKAEISTSST